MFTLPVPAKSVVSMTAVLACMAVSTAATAASLELDPTWGGAGSVETTFGGTLSNSTVAVLVQPDGKVVAVGTHGEGPDAGYAQSFAAARFNPDGSLDETFGAGGRLIVPRDPSVAKEDARAAALLPNGQIVVAGDSRKGSDFCSTAVRLNPTGSIDTSFGTNGHVVPYCDFGTDWIEKLFVQSDGKLLARRTGGFLRWDANGLFDTQFGSLSGTAVLQAGDKIVDVTSDGAGAIHLHRYNRDGSLDSSFQGRSPEGTARYLPLQVEARADGKLVVNGSGTMQFGINVAFVMIFNADGSYASETYYATSAREQREPSALGIQPDQAIVTGGRLGGPQVIRLPADNGAAQTWTGTAQQDCGVTSFGFGTGRTYAGCYASDGLKVVAFRAPSVATDSGTGAPDAITHDSDVADRAIGDAKAGNASSGATNADGGCSMAHSPNSLAALTSAACAALALVIRRRRPRRLR